MLQGSYLDQLHCHHCQRQSSSVRIFNSFELALPPHGRVTLDELLESWCREEFREGYICEVCHAEGRTSQKAVVVENGWPSVLVIMLKRFHGLHSKIHTRVAFPETWLPRADIRYSLQGVLVHQGASQLVGHYTAYVRDSNAIWYNCDDSLPPRALETAEELLRAEAYMLFYVRMDGPHL